ncbi:MAG TPA: hypothetical protein VFD58_18435 [Blastocatellia bacterium]|nr:hypothetical protein [Blastocatellia bacterium]
MMNPLDRIRRRRRREAVTGGTTRLTGSLKLPEGLQAANGATADTRPGDDGIIRLKNTRLHVSSDLLESGRDASSQGTDKVVIVIVVCSLIFIGIIAWFVAHE